MYMYTVYYKGINVQNAMKLQTLGGGGIAIYICTVYFTYILCTENSTVFMSFFFFRKLSRLIKFLDQNPGYAKFLENRDSITYFSHKK